MFSKLEQNAINEKLEQLTKLKEGILSKKELINIITKRRINWIQDNIKEVLIKYKEYSIPEMAYRTIFFDHMKINPKDSEMVIISLKKIRINSYNFCPYFEACKRLGLDIKFICKEIGEPPIIEMLKFINPNLRFSRNYENIRPKNNFCEEYIELL